MHIKSLHLKNFRRFEDATFEFAPGFNLLVGENGAGKSSAIDGVLTSLNEFGRVSGDEESGEILPSTKDIRRSPKSNFLNKRFDTVGRCETVAIYKISELQTLEDLHSRDMVGIYPAKGRGLSAEWEIAARSIAEGDAQTLSVVAYFSAQRGKQIDEDLDLKSVDFFSKEGRMDAYWKWRIAGKSIHSLLVWVLFQSLYKNYHRDNYPNLGRTDELSIVSRAIADCMPECFGIEFSGPEKDMIIEFEHGRFALFDTLSDGQRGLIAMVADIARRACLLNPHLGDKVLKETPGIILIDELDLHLHPKWQRRIVGDLKRTFPKMQFIATTHSPQIIGQCRREEVIIVTETGGQHPAETFGLDSNSVLRSIMGAEDRDPETARLLDRLFTEIDEYKFEDARATLKTLRENHAGDLYEVTEAEHALARLDGRHDEAAE